MTETASDELLADLAQALARPVIGKIEPEVNAVGLALGLGKNRAGDGLTFCSFSADRRQLAVNFRQGIGLLSPGRPGEVQGQRRAVQRRDHWPCSLRRHRRAPSPECWRLAANRPRRNG